MIIVWSVETGSVLKRIWFRSSDTLIRSIYYQDEQVFAGGLDEKVRQIDLVSGKVVKTISLNSGIYSVVAEANSLFVGASRPPYVLKLDINSGAIIQSLDGHSSGIFSLFLRDGLLFSGSIDKTIICWNAVNGEMFQTYLGHSGMVYSVSVYDGELYSTAPTGELFKWSIYDGTITKKFPEVHLSTISTLAYRSQTLFTGSYDTKVIKWDAVSGDILFRYSGTNSKIRSVVSWKNFIVCGGDDGEIRMWDASIDSIDPFATFDNNLAFIITLYVFEDNVFWETIMETTFSAPDDVTLCFAASKLSLYGGGYSGSIYQWNISSGIQIAFFRAHSDQIISSQLTDEILYSGSLDITSKAWNTKTLEIVRDFAASNPVSAVFIEAEFLIACAYTSVEMFSVISGENKVLVIDLTVRRWSTITGKHVDVYFGFTKAVSTISCYNGSVFAKSADFSVLMFKPNLPHNQDGALQSRTTIPKRITNQKRIVRLSKAEGGSMDFPLVHVSVSVALVVIMVGIFAFVFFKKGSKKIVSRQDQSSSIEGTESAQTIMDLETVVNSVMGISKHAAYLMENSALAKVKKIAAGGGGELFLAKVMDPVLKKKIPQTVVQKIVFAKSKVNEEAFYQEVGIMILLNVFPNFYGSLYDWASKNHYGTKIILKLLRETASALSVMHSHYLAHCDLKPQNILVQVDNDMPSCYLTDFGITQILSEKIIASKSFNIINLRGLSVHYASPEAFTSFRTKKYSRVDFTKYDVYSFACVMFELITREVPWS
ncbi:hypothetical protein MP638_001689 [Amoeboaphelidium occidentale]|nr:hypothetical protein MP638_001689 [Amoeboaphelidium occidentale]